MQNTISTKAAEKNIMKVYKKLHDEQQRKINADTWRNAITVVGKQKDRKVRIEKDKTTSESLVWNFHDKLSAYRFQ